MMLTNRQGSIDLVQGTPDMLMLKTLARGRAPRLRDSCGHGTVFVLWAFRILDVRLYIRAGSVARTSAFEVRGLSDCIAIP